MSGRRSWAIWAVVTFFVTTSAAWAASTGVLDLDLSVSSESTLPGGQAVDVTPLSGTFTAPQGAAAKKAGIELYRLDLGNIRYSDSMMVQFAITNPQDMADVFGNPNAYLEVAMWYEDAAGTHTLSDGTTKVLKDEATSTYLNQENAYTLMMPETAGIDTYWVLATITVPSGGPVGQQQPDDLRFWIDVRVI